MRKQRRIIDASFKLDVVRMVKEQGLSVRHVSQSIDIGQAAIRRWLKQYEAEANGKRMGSWASVISSLLSSSGSRNWNTRTGNCAAMSMY
jgi:transposase-like protein